MVLASGKKIGNEKVTGEKKKIKQSIYVSSHFSTIKLGLLHCTICYGVCMFDHVSSRCSQTCALEEGVQVLRLRGPQIISLQNLENLENPKAKKAFYIMKWSRSFCTFRNLALTFFRFEKWWSNRKVTRLY